MDKFWEGFEKRAWDGDYEGDGEYGIQANRAMHPSHDLHKTLLTASKDKNLRVKVWTHDKGAIEGHDNIKAHLDGLKKKYPEGGGLAWERNHVWSIGAKTPDNDKGRRKTINYIYNKHMHTLRGKKS